MSTEEKTITASCPLAGQSVLWFQSAAAEPLGGGASVAAVAPICARHAVHPLVIGAMPVRQRAVVLRHYAAAVAAARLPRRERDLRPVVRPLENHEAAKRDGWSRAVEWLLAAGWLRRAGAWRRRAGAWLWHQLVTDEEPVTPRVPPGRRKPR